MRDNCYNGFMKSKFRSFLPVLALAILLAFGIGFLSGRNSQTVETPPAVISPEPNQVTGPVETPVEKEDVIDEDGWFYSKEDVALYIHTYGTLPSNFITKSKASDLGYSASKNNLWKVCDGCCIGGDRFGNREGLLPEKNGRKYFECDIDYNGKERGAKRIVFSNDGLIYYTDDHYESFTLLYGEP